MDPRTGSHQKRLKRIVLFLSLDNERPHLNHSAPLFHNEYKKPWHRLPRVGDVHSGRGDAQGETLFFAHSIFSLRLLNYVRAESELENQFQYSYNKNKSETLDLRGPFSAVFVNGSPEGVVKIAETISTFLVYLRIASTTCRPILENKRTNSKMRSRSVVVLF